MSLVNATPGKSASVLALLLVALNLRPALASLGPVLESVRVAFHLSNAIAALLTSLPVICMGLFAPLAMPLSARVGIKRAILAMLLLLGCATLARLWATLPSLLLSSVCIGAALALLGPLLNAYIKQHFAASSSRVSAWATTAICIGASLGASGSTPISSHVGWPVMLSSWAMLAFIAAWLWQRLALDQFENAQPRRTTLPWRELRAWLLMLMFGLNGGLFYGLLTWLAPAYRSYGLSASAAGQLLGLFTLIQIIGTALVSILPTRGDRRPVLVLLALAAVAGSLGLWRMPMAAPYLWMLLVGASTAGLFALTMILPLDFSDSAAAAASWTAMMCGGGYVVAAMVPYFFGVLVDVTGNYSAMFAALSAANVMVMLLCMLMSPQRPMSLVSGL